MVSFNKLREGIAELDKFIDEELNGNPEGISLLDVIERDAENGDDEISEYVADIIRRLTDPMTHETVYALGTAMEKLIDYLNYIETVNEE